MELVYKFLPWILVGGSVLVVIYIIIAVSFGVFFFKEYKKNQEYHTNRAEKMAEMRK